jgi:hypothetical protein
MVYSLPFRPFNLKRGVDVLFSRPNMMNMMTIIMITTTMLIIMATSFLIKRLLNKNKMKIAFGLFIHTVLLPTSYKANMYIV